MESVFGSVYVPPVLMELMRACEQYLYIFYRRSQSATPLPAVQAIQFLSPKEAKVPAMESQLVSEGWQVAKESLHSGIWRAETLNLWYRVGTRGNAFTELDVVFGTSSLRPGWEDVGIISQLANKAVVKLQGRRQNAPPAPAKPSLRFRGANFKVLQIADLHFSVSDGLCRDIVNNTACPAVPEAADNATIKWLRPLVEEVRPDLIILSGDQLNGQETSWDAASVINKVAALFVSLAIPWTLVFGNHDSEATNLDRAGQMKIYENLPYFVGSAGPSAVAGVGNYRLELKSADPSNTTLFNLYFLDSHANYKPFFQEAQYDWIKESQISWFKAESRSVNPILRPYQAPDLSHETGPFNLADNLDDYALRKRQSREQELLKPNAMAIWHIPGARPDFVSQ